MVSRLLVFLVADESQVKRPRNGAKSTNETRWPGAERPGDRHNRWASRSCWHLLDREARSDPNLGPTTR